MSKRTLILIAVLVLLASLLVVVALSQRGTKPTPTPVSQVVPSPTPVVQTVLAIEPNPINAIRNATTSANVTIATGGNSVTAVQLELSFDPKVLRNLALAHPLTGGFFANPVVLLNKVDSEKGTVTFAIAIPPSGNAKSGRGTVATITFTAQGAAGQTSQIAILPKSLVTATGTSGSVLRSMSGTTIILR